MGKIRTVAWHSILRAPLTSRHNQPHRFINPDEPSRSADPVDKVIPRWMPVLPWSVPTKSRASSEFKRRVDEGVEKLLAAAGGGAESVRLAGGGR